MAIFKRFIARVKLSRIIQIEKKLTTPRAIRM